MARGTPAESQIVHEAGLMTRALGAGNLLFRTEFPTIFRQNIKKTARNKKNHADTNPKF